MNDYENINIGSVVQPLPPVWCDSIAMLGRICAFIKACLLPGEAASKHKGSREAGNRGCETLLPVAARCHVALSGGKTKEGRKESASEKQNMSLCPACLAEHRLVCQIRAVLLLLFCFFCRCFFFPPPPFFLSSYSPRKSLVNLITGPVLSVKGEYCMSVVGGDYSEKNVCSMSSLDHIFLFDDQIHH